MSLNSVINRNDYTGTNSLNTYSYGFKIFSENDLYVVVRLISTGAETVLTKTTDYTVTGVGNSSGGNIVLVNSGQAWLTSGFLKNTYKLVVRRKRELKQTADIKNQGDFYPEVHEDVFDKLVMVDQQQQDDIDRSIKFPDSVPSSSFNSDLPATLVGAANVSIVTNATGDGFEAGPTSSAIANAQAEALAAAASAASALVSENNAATSETNAGISETNAAASAAAAATTLTSALWRDVIFITSASSPYTVAQADNSKLLVCDTSSGAIVINLPLISSITLPFTLGVKLEAGANPVTINRSGTDLIGSATSKIILTAGSGTQLLADTSPAPDKWTDVDFGFLSGNYIVELYSGNGVQTDFTLPVDPGSDQNTNVFISGVYQQKDTYTVVGTLISFSTAPPAGTTNIEINIGSAVSIGTPSDGTVSTAKIVDLNVTTAKIDNLAVTTAKIANGAVTQAKRAPLGEQISSTVNFSSTSGTFVSVTNASVSITTTGRPVYIGFISDGASSDISVSTGVALTFIEMRMEFLRNGATTKGISISQKAASATTNIQQSLPPSAFSHIDIPAAGTYTYSVRARSSGAGEGFGFNTVKLIAYEL